MSHKQKCRERLPAALAKYLLTTVVYDVRLRNHDRITFRIKTTTNQRVYKSPYHRGVYLWEQTHVVETQKSADGLKFKKHALQLFYYNCYNGNPRITCVCKKEP